MWNQNVGGQGFPFGAQGWPRQEAAPRMHGIPAQQQMMYGSQMPAQMQVPMAANVPHPSPVGMQQMGGWNAMNPGMQLAPMPQVPVVAMQQHFNPMLPHTQVPNASPHVQVHTPVRFPHYQEEVQNQYQLHQYNTNMATHVGPVQNNNVGLPMQPSSVVPLQNQNGTYTGQPLPQGAEPLQPPEPPPLPPSEPYPPPPLPPCPDQVWHATDNSAIATANLPSADVAHSQGPAKNVASCMPVGDKYFPVERQRSPSVSNDNNKGSSSRELHSPSRKSSPRSNHSSPSRSRIPDSRSHSSPRRSHYNSPNKSKDDARDKHSSTLKRGRSPVAYTNKRRSYSNEQQHDGSRKQSHGTVRCESQDRDRNSVRLRCYSPPPPDSTRKVKFIMPEEYYNRVKKDAISDSTITGTPKLARLYDRFEEKVLNSGNSDALKKDQIESKKEEVGNNNEDLDTSDFESVTGSEFSESKKLDGAFSDDEFELSDEQVESDTEAQKQESLSDSSGDEGYHDNGPSAEEVRQRKMKDPKRLHRELWFNEKGETNEGPVCRCSAKEKVHGIRHAIYPGEKVLSMCDLLGNNGNKLHHYWVTVTPHANFVTDQPTAIHHGGRDFVFEGFSVLSHEPLEKVPSCSFIRFNIEYQIHFVKQPVPKNFCIRGIDLFSRFVFSNVLELFDWTLKDEDRDECQRFHFLPRFVYRRAEQEKGLDVHELLSMDKVLSHLMDSNTPLIQPSDLEMPASKRSEFAKSCRNQVVRKPGKKPDAFRIDDVDFSCCDDNSKSAKYPRVVHHGIRPVQMSYAGNPKYQKLWKSYKKLQNTITNRPVSSRKDHDRLIQLRVELQRMKLKSSMRRDFQITLGGKGVMKTGIRSDICQHAMVLPVLVHHIRYHACLSSLDNKLGYTFKDRMLLQLALTHPSYHLNYGMNPDHARNSLSNCGVKQPRYGDRRIHLVHSKKKGIMQLTRVMANLAKVEENNSLFADNDGKLAPDRGKRRNGMERKYRNRQAAWQTDRIRHNERLEFLGDAVLEFICSKHLFFMLPDKPEGDLAVFRSALVQNRHLAVLAKRLELSDYMQFAHGPDLCLEEDLNHAMANCLEALLGAMYLEAGLQVTTEFFARLAFTETDLFETWMKLPKHQLQVQHPDGDRHLVKTSPVLQKLEKFEEASGIPFTHIRLLARAVTHPQVGFNNLTLGDNQRLEFLGDSVLQFVVSVFLYRYFPEHHEGHLTLLRSSLVNSRVQAEIARQLTLEEYMNFGAKGVKPMREKMLADVLEAFIAALFVDKGLRHVEVFCRVCFFSRLENNIVNQEWMDAKSQLQQCCLSLRVEGKTPDLPVYKVLQDAGPAHRKTYIVGVYYRGKRYGKGEGQSIQQAEMAAAKEALSSSYFPELARQKHLLDRKHGDKRAVRTNPDRTPDRSRTTSRSPRANFDSPRKPRRLLESSRKTTEGSRRVSESPRKGSDRSRSPSSKSRGSSASARKADDPHGLLDPDDSWVDIDVSEICSEQEEAKSKGM